ncbi:prolyl oligopeptidase family serine peptidase [Robertkochia solimangrovi]|uniref:carboxylesterase family protein n=1 Tax=Robertkochia solimangrovi TaxID=2213046 RepID=UPI00117EE254|nr:prolyl oligopeptidase family serine peptidase [Robertkochia solimangrovi]TRZ43660.1 phospholipase [Robertkochia solimangrovi]
METRLFYLVLLLWFVALPVMAQEDSLYESKVLVRDSDSLFYRIMYPENMDKTKSYPLVVFLHGAGERGDDNNAQLVHGGKVFADPLNRKHFPAIVIFPQCSKEDYWSNATVDRSETGVKLKFNSNVAPSKALRMVLDLLDQTLKESYIDKSRVYIAGLSMGGMGTFEMLWRRPDVFAAAIAICGGGDPEMVEQYAQHTDMWVIHGAMDDVVDPVYSLTMVEALLKAGAHPKFTLYDTANHNSWDPAFAEPDFLPWMFSKQLNDN